MEDYALHQGECHGFTLCEIVMVVGVSKLSHIDLIGESIWGRFTFDRYQVGFMGMMVGGIEAAESAVF